MRAARAAECAAGIHRFPEAVDLLFAHQEALSDEHWPWFLPRVARTDSVRLVRCMADTVPMPLVDSSVALGRRMKIMGTPTIFLNGWRYPGAPTDSELSRAVSDLLAGRRPYASFPETAIDARALFRGKN